MPAFGVTISPWKHGWREPADTALILQSVRELIHLATRRPELVFAIPLPGTGNGGLAPELVWPLLKGLPDNVTVVVDHVDKLPKKEV